jgi:hypothetical protein
MTSQTGAGHRGFHHELLLHRSAAELLELVLPLVRDDLAAEEPTLLLADDLHLLRSPAGQAQPAGLGRTGRTAGAAMSPTTRSRSTTLTARVAAVSGRRYSASCRARTASGGVTCRRSCSSAP